ncbi:hypothetical protein CFC21_102811 [Triticum aestivum]|uniref:Uncharacterized protein n=2 Tax=Triticum aestivum TaxID=4565 RepID=A0A9R1M6B2_WHEAT|nr:hypothetical protein CFC21_102811 [Triticum aestivum]
MSTLLCVRLSDASLCPLPKRYGLLQFTQCLGEEFVASNEKMSLENLGEGRRPMTGRRSRPSRSASKRINSTENISVLYVCLRAPRDAVIDSDWSLKFGTLRIKASSFQKLLVVAHGLEQLGNH